MSTRRVASLAWVIGLSLCVGSPASAQAEKVLRPAVYAKVTLTALGYMRKPAAFFRGGKFNLLVIHSANRSSKALAQDIANAFRALGKKKKIGKSVRVGKTSTYEYSDAEDLAAKLRAGSYNCVYIATGLQENLEKIVEVTRAADALSITCKTSYVKAGAAFAVVQLGTRPRLVINVRAAKQEGARFGSRLLSRATVVGR